MKKFFGLLLCALLVSPPLLAAPACYSIAELEAEQTLRLHSELMVITVTCRSGSKGQNLVPAYTGFTRAHIQALQEAEQTMINYYVRDGKGGIAQLDKLRTKLGNEFGQKSADMSAPAFCAKYRDRVLAFYSGDAEKLEEEVQAMVAHEDSYGQLCSSSRTRIAKKSR
ncbi:MAG: hypothetical protein SFW62_09000 [Alphaproteobacteria bacterium]|nr:hypothetical protein [Alphaproteobacteria bacterium]